MVRAIAKRILPKGIREKLKELPGVMRKRRQRPNLYRIDTAERIGIAYSAPSDMLLEERFFLFSLIRGFRPERVLEIGVFQGGSGAIICNAMEDNGVGRCVGIDPEPDMKVKENDFHGRYTLLRKASPDGIEEAKRILGGAFDFVLIDGLHIYEQVCRDIEGVLPSVADGGYILFHDAFHYGVSEAIAEAVEASGRLTDCGYVCRTARLNDPWTPYNGFRLLRVAARGRVNVEDLAGKMLGIATMPKLERDVLNHDLWYCRFVRPCERCRKMKEEARKETAVAAR